MKLIQSGQLWYQPFILADGIEVGEGQNLDELYSNTHSIFDHNVFLSPEHRSYWLGNPRKLATDGAYFRACNRKYRFGYEFLAEHIVARMGGDISTASFLEIGCNTGLNLFNLAKRGAGSCVGVDWTENGPVFEWLNDLLDTQVRFLCGSYDGLTHTIPGVDVPHADVVINTVFVNHQCDPIQVLCYLADHARKGLFLWILLDERSGDELMVTYDRMTGVHDLGAAGRPLPLNFYNGVRPSTALLKECLCRLGFEDIEFVAPPANAHELLPRALRPFQMVWARRTHERPSAFALSASALPDLAKMERRIQAAEEAVSRAQEARLRAEEITSAAEQRLLVAERDLSSLRKSCSFRLGRIMTGPLRWVRRLFAAN